MTKLLVTYTLLLLLFNYTTYGYYNFITDDCKNRGVEERAVAAEEEVGEGEEEDIVAKIEALNKEAFFVEREALKAKSISVGLYREAKRLIKVFKVQADYGLVHEAVETLYKSLNKLKESKMKLSESLSLYIEAQQTNSYIYDLDAQVIGKIGLSLVKQVLKRKKSDSPIKEIEELSLQIIDKTIKEQEKSFPNIGKNKEANREKAKFLAKTAISVNK